MDHGALQEKKDVQRQSEFSVQNAVNKTGFGKFNLKHAAVCGLIIMNVGVSTSSPGLILPAAACDFKMTSMDKGRLTAAPMLGMVCGSYFWGCLADMRGRKAALLAALFMNWFVDFLASVSPNYWVFVFLKFLTGFAITGQSSILYPYLGEFQPTKFRERILCWTEMAFTGGLIVIPLVGWAIIPLTFEYRTKHFFFRSWNLFVFICSLPPLWIAICLLFLPESPKYLFEDGQEDKALKVLAGMYAENTNDSPENYPVKHISCRHGDGMITLSKGVDKKVIEPKWKKKSMKKMLRDICVQTAAILKPPFLKRTAMICTVQFCVTSSCYTMMLWFPELFQRFAEFEKHHPEVSASVCMVSAVTLPVNGTEILERELFGCGDQIQTSVYVHTLLLGLACVPTSIWLPVCVDRLGYRFFLLFSTVVSSAVSIGFLFVTSSVQNLVLSCVFEAFTSLAISIVYCVVVNVFPTNLRMMACSLSVLCGRSGALFGNLMFGYLIDIHCVVPIAVVATMLLGFDFLAEGGADFEHAITTAGFGKFHYSLLALCGLIYMNTAIGVTILSFVLPAAACDLEMDSTSKGWLTASPMLGMVIGSYIWGCLADTKGRKIVLIATLLMDGIVGLISSVVQYYWFFLVLRFFNGFAITGAMGICFPYLGEFQPTKYREKILCWMEMFWTVGVIVLPLIAWAIIPLNINFVTDAFYFKSWNLFVAICALPSLLIGLWLFLFPESPKFLLECGEPEAALKVFKWIYAQNTGDSAENYPVKSLQEKANPREKSTRKLKLIKRKDLKVLCTEVWNLTKALCRPPYRFNTVLTCAIQFGLTSSYYTLMVWFPELFTRFEEFEEHYPNATASVCIVSSMSDDDASDPYGCDTIIASSVYLHTVYIGLACIPGSIILPLFVHKVGAKAFLIFSLVVSGAVTIAFYYVINSMQNLILSCIFEALTSLGISLLYCVIVDMFPTNLRVMAAALSLTMGRVGSLVGSLVFGYLIDLACVVPIILFGAFLFICGGLSFLLPKTGKDTLD